MNGNAISTDIAPNSNGKKLMVDVKMEKPTPAKTTNGSGFETQISTVSNDKDPPQIAL